MYPEVNPADIRIGVRVRVNIPNHRYHQKTGIVEEVTTLGGYKLKPAEYKSGSVVKIRLDEPSAYETIFRFYLRTLQPLTVKTTHEVW